MESNKDEASRCVKIAEAALVSGDKQRALKFIRIARRLDDSLSLEDLVEACERLENADSSDLREAVDSDRVCQDFSSCVANGDRGYTDEHVQVIREIRKTKDYYAILGVEKGCSVEGIRKAYRKLSLKVHPDKNKAPGAEEAFKSVCKAFKCLSDDQSRQNYDQTGAVEDYEFNEQHGNVRRRRRRRATTRNDFFDEDFDPDEIFRSFFFGTPNDVFRAQRAYRARATGRQYRENNGHAHERDEGGGAFNFITLLQILPFLLFLLFVYMPFNEPDYSLQQTFAFQIPKVTVEHGVHYFVKSEDFEQQFPQGSSARENFEENVLRDYKGHLRRYCHIELQRRQWSRNYPTPHCDKLRSLEVVW